MAKRVRHHGIGDGGDQFTVGRAGLEVAEQADEQEADGQHDPENDKPDARTTLEVPRPVEVACIEVDTRDPPAEVTTPWDPTVGWSGILWGVTDPERLLTFEHRCTDTRSPPTSRTCPVRRLWTSIRGTVTRSTIAMANAWRPAGH
ncbi:hypothetical protein Axi01nite_70970 [Actinoplanes xinjiangensis]|nr:hypothetical protein Axi01nite_70970 [Actinoplanes xinjiangensis]